MCSGDYAGLDCSQRLSPLLPSWSAVPGPPHLTRVGHTLVSCAFDAGPLLYLFGGYSVERGLLSDLWTYSVTTGRWRMTQIGDTRTRPTPRSVAYSVVEFVFRLEKRFEHYS